MRRANRRDTIPATQRLQEQRFVNSPKMSVKPSKAMVLAAGLGVRMRPLTDRMPKPLVPVAGRALLDHALDKLGDAGIGGAVVKALPLLGHAPFFHVNADTLWIDGVRPNLTRLAETFDPERMDILLLMAPTTSSIGYGGRGDYAMLPDGALRKRREHQVVPFVYAGAAIMSPSLFANAPSGEFSLTKMFDSANERERLFGLRLDGVWMHVGTPDAVHAAEEAFLASVA